MNWRLWMRGLIAAVINSMASTVTVIIVDPLDFNLSSGLGRLGSVAVVSAILGGALYLKEHPLPD